MTTPEIKLDLLVTESDADDERLDELTGRLIRNLRALGVQSVERPSGGTGPEGAMGDPVTLGSLAIAILPPFLPELLKFLRDFAGRGDDQDRRVRIKMPSGMEIEFTPDKKFSNAELLALVKALTGG